MSLILEGAFGQPSTRGKFAPWTSNCRPRKRGVRSCGQSSGPLLEERWRGAPPVISDDGSKTTHVILSELMGPTRLPAVRQATSQKAWEVARPPVISPTLKDKPALYFPFKVAQLPDIHSSQRARWVGHPLPAEI